MMFDMCNKEHKWHLLIFSKIDIIWFNRKTPSPLIVNFEQVIESALVWNLYFTFLVDCTFYKSTEE